MLLNILNSLGNFYAKILILIIWFSIKIFRKFISYLVTPFPVLKDKPYLHSTDIHKDFYHHPHIHHGNA